MAIAALALRIATVLALRGRTLAESRVSDSEITALDLRVESNRKPSIVVYTDEGVLTPEVASLIEGSATQVLSLELAGATSIAFDGENQPAVVTIPETDQGLELSLDLLDRDIRRVLSAEDTRWAVLWRRLVLRIVKIECSRGAGLKDGVRFAARQLSLTLETVREPGFAEPEGVWSDFLDALEQESEASGLPKLATLIESAIRGKDLADWRQIQALYAMTDAGIRGIGLAPLGPSDPQVDPPVVAQLTVDGDDGPRIITPPPSGPED